MSLVNENILTRRSPVFGQWVIPLAVGSAAVMIGVLLGQGGWYFLPVVVLLPLLWFWPVETAMGAAVLLLPFEYVTSLGASASGGSDRTLMSLAVVLAFCVLVAAGVVGRRIQQPSMTVVWWMLFTAWAAASTAWAVEPKMAMSYLPSACSLFLFYLAACSFRISEKEFDRIVWLTILGGAVAATLSVYGFYFGAGFSQHATRATLAAGGGHVNPNRFGSCLLLPLAFALARVLTVRNRLAKILALSLLGITSLGLLLTMSRGITIAAIVTVLVFFYRLNALPGKSLKPTVRRFMVLTVVVVVVLAAIIPASLFGRFQQSVADRGSGRFDIWKAGLVMFTHYPVVGAGLNNFPVVYTKYAGYASHLYSSDSADAHNVYLAIAVEEGLVGLLLFLMAVRKQFQIVSKCRARIVGSPIMLVCCEAAFCGMLVVCFFGNFLWDKSFWFAWVLLAFAITVQTTKTPETVALPPRPLRFYEQ